MDIKLISIEEGSKIIDTREPLGLFYRYCVDENVFVGLDNSTGDANVEGFETLDECIAWLRGEDQVCSCCRTIALEEEIKSLKDRQTYMKEIQSEIYHHYGIDHQLEKLEEECLELALAIKQRDGRNYIGLSNIVEEIADVENIIEQIKNSNKHIIEGIEKWKEFKINREVDRISQRYQNKGFEEKSKEIDCRFDL